MLTLVTSSIVSWLLFRVSTWFFQVSLIFWYFSRKSKDISTSYFPEDKVHKIMFLFWTMWNKRFWTFFHWSVCEFYFCLKWAYVGNIFLRYRIFEVFQIWFGNFSQKFEVLVFKLSKWQIRWQIGAFSDFFLKNLSFQAYKLEHSTKQFILDQSYFVSRKYFFIQM